MKKVSVDEVREALESRARSLGSLGDDGDRARTARLAARLLEFGMRPHPSTLRSVGLCYRDGSYYLLAAPAERVQDER